MLRGDVLQVRYPDRITLIRGNHESRQITQVFFQDCQTLCVSVGLLHKFLSLSVARGGVCLRPVFFIERALGAGVRLL